jgi:predicted ArsR family transcriptional regulator
MRNDTRKLLRAMADDKVDELLEQLRVGAGSEAELRQALGLSHRAASERLSHLQSLGLVRARTRPAAGRGRPAREWRLTHAELLARFVAQAESAAAELARHPPGER